MSSLPAVPSGPSLMSASITSFSSKKGMKKLEEGVKLPSIITPEKKSRIPDGVRPLYLPRAKPGPPGQTVEVRYGYYAMLLHKQALARRGRLKQKQRSSSRNLRHSSDAGRGTPQQSGRDSQTKRRSRMELSGINE